MTKNNTAEIGFEKEIWKAADLLRGNLDASEYKSGCTRPDLFEVHIRPFRGKISGTRGRRVLGI